MVQGADAKFMVDISQNLLFILSECSLIAGGQNPGAHLESCSYLHTSRGSYVVAIEMYAEVCTECNALNLLLA